MNNPGALTLEDFIEHYKVKISIMDATGDDECREESQQILALLRERQDYRSGKRSAPKAVRWTTKEETNEK